jgi:hypothetical protein
MTKLFFKNERGFAQQQRTPNPASSSSSGGGGASSEDSGAGGGSAVGKGASLNPKPDTDKTKISTPVKSKVERFTKTPFKSRATLT